MIDYQWPSPSNLKPFLYQSDSKSNNNLYKSIESYFEEKFNTDSILVPSGRAGIAMVIRFFQIDRSKDVFVSKWLSHCMFNTIGAFSNPTTTFTENVDMVIINHKWGIPVTTKKKCSKKLMLEDSVDSVFTNFNSIFPNNADFEIFSLPKIIGSYSGGIILSKNSEFSKYARALQHENLELASYQSKIKYLDAKNELVNFDSWFYHESWNTSLDVNSLEDISSALPNYEKNKNIILKRLESLEKCTGYTIEDTGRLGPVAPLSEKKYKVKDSELFLTRNFASTKYIEDQEYELVKLLPLHIGISEEQFNYMLDSVSKI